MELINDAYNAPSPWAAAACRLEEMGNSMCCHGRLCGQSPTSGCNKAPLLRTHRPIHAGACPRIIVLVCFLLPFRVLLGGALSAVRTQCNYLGIWPY